MPDKKIAAFFDFDGTLYDGVIAVDVLKYGIRKRKLRMRDLARLSRFIYYYALDKLKLRDRYIINVKIYKRLKKWRASNLESMSKEYFKLKLKENLYPHMIEVIDSHRKQGHKIIIVTSAIKEVIAQIRDYLPIDDIIASEVEIKNDIYTGIITNLPVGKARPKAIEDYCRKNSISIKDCYAYSDHYSDIPMLSVVGNPIAANPEIKLKLYAKRHNWKIIQQNKPFQNIY